MAGTVRNIFEAEAIALMREALELLDSGGGSDAAATLQHAIDIAEGQPPMREGDQLDTEAMMRILGPLDLAPRGPHLGADRAKDWRTPGALVADREDWAHH
jgi:hypothetical protein